MSARARGGRKSIPIVWCEGRELSRTVEVGWLPSGNEGSRVRQECSAP